ncbi:MULTISPECIES: PQQ-dependent dehydrogenase, methanol/ethanol family [unclassified Sphingobium]|uniref:PQQ-dependent dehydrogenase, methanol/ethanol family n=1 Tax=unclassified Sphingobium TaxID=2611147 RepID=UPI0009E7A433|nr:MULTISPECIES: PQQ-dependent dehydrogenase, methanol/ethanol family [unclassified Sphingobium]
MSGPNHVDRGQRSPEGGRPAMTGIAAGLCRRLLAPFLVAAMTIGLAACRGPAEPSVGGSSADWAHYGGTQDEMRFSRLEEINDGNVASLGLAWSLDLEGEHQLEATPLAVGGTLYFTGQDASVYAVDARTGKRLWRWDSREWALRPQTMHYIFSVNRGAAYWQGKVYVGTRDGRLVALDSRTGRPIWSRQTVAEDSFQFITGAPRVFNGKVIIGNGGGDWAARGYVTAYDANSGRQLWRFYTVPGDPAKPFEQPALAMAAKSWTGQWWKWGGGGTVWDGITYDAEMNRIYIGAGNSGPYNPRLRTPGGGDNLFLASIVALDADTGRYIWHYQVNPQEAWDYKAAAQMTLARLTIDGKPRRVLMQAPTNGFFYVIDRDSGKLISAEKIGKVNWAERIDVKSGRPVEVPNVRYEKGPITIWPGPQGAHNWQSMAYNPDTGLVYIPYMQLGAVYEEDKAFLERVKANGGEPIFGVSGAGTHFSIHADPNDRRDGKGELIAWDPVAQKARWRVQYDSLWNGGTMTTRGNLVFQGDADGILHGYDARTGKQLWRFNAGLGIIAPPITYEVGGRQYLSLLVGYGGGVAMLGRYADRGWKYNAQPRRLLTFALGGKARLPKTAPADFQVRAVDDPKLVLDEAAVKRGAKLYGANMCHACHGAGLNNTGVPGPDLRESGVALDYQAFSQLLSEGPLMERGMPRFETLSDADKRALWSYIRAGARVSLGKRKANDAPVKATAF